MTQYHFAEVGEGATKYQSNRTGICPKGLIEMKSAPPPNESWIAVQDGSYSLVRDIDDLRILKIEQINKWRNTTEGNESQTVKAINSMWDAGPNARLRIDSTILTGRMPPYWTDANNVDHEGMTLEELKQVKIAISELGFAIHDRQRTMKKEVEALTDFDEILNYPVGWPQS